jgi:hypothetical protein
MGIGEVGSVNGDKPQVHADKSTSKGSATEFNDVLGRSQGSSSSTQAAAGSAARASGGKPTIVRIDANYHSKSATATLSDGSKVPISPTKNKLPPGVDLNRLTPEQLQRYKTYVQKQDAAKGPHEPPRPAASAQWLSTTQQVCIETC